MSEIIALCGIDGTGKSTQAELLGARLEAQGRRTKLLWCRWDPFLARPAVRLLDRLSRRGTGGAERSSHVAPDNRRALKSRLLSSRLIRSLWTTLMVVDYGLQIAPRLLIARHSADVVIVDRYRHDVLIDLSAGGELMNTPRLLRWMLPEPDRLVILDVEEDVAFARKPDSLDIKYLSDRRRLYLRLAEVTGASVIDTNASSEDVGEAVFRAVGLEAPLL